ncbi:hypothetical protein CEE44_04495 [Candidatus Woesearchaeota archaeon B3_Woes]|nr:MAG: hypothetical protein CEE44_04495 [Candidatus Woesearchaeota archaeon B3_Woes]
MYKPLVIGALAVFTAANVYAADLSNKLIKKYSLSPKQVQEFKPFEFYSNKTLEKALRNYTIQKKDDMAFGEKHQTIKEFLEEVDAADGETDGYITDDGVERQKESDAFEGMDSMFD